MDHNQKLTTMSSEYFNHRGELGQRLRNAIQHETLHTRRYPILAAALGHGRPDSASQPPIAMAVGDLQHDQSTVTSTSDDQITSRYPILAAALMGGDGMTTQNQESVQISHSPNVAAALPADSSSNTASAGMPAGNNSSGRYDNWFGSTQSMVTSTREDQIGGSGLADDSMPGEEQQLEAQDMSMDPQPPQQQ